jgi:hypothetical protein
MESQTSIVIDVKAMQLDPLLPEIHKILLYLAE